MPIHIGIMCKMRRKVHFIATSHRITPSKLAAGMYRLACNPPCLLGEFRKENMRPYRVAENVFRRGRADESEYELVEQSAPGSHFDRAPKEGSDSRQSRAG
jgi:hypothetical protein